MKSWLDLFGMDWGLAFQDNYIVLQNSHSSISSTSTSSSTLTSSPPQLELQNLKEANENLKCQI